MRHLILGLLALAVSAAAMAEQPARFVLRADYISGSPIPQVLATSAKIPLNKRYENLSIEQKKTVASQYVDLREGDEPPFPADGLAPVVRTLQKAQAELRVTGALYLVVDIAPDGSADEVRAMGSPSPEMTQFAASVLMLTKYKPGICAGQPCRMQFPFALKFGVE